MSTRPLRIVHVFFKYPPAIGGQELYVQQLVEGLHARGFDAHVVTSDLRVHRDGGERLDATYDIVNDIPVTRLRPEEPVTSAVVIPFLREALIALEPDLVHAHDMIRDSTRVAIDFAREHGVPLFVNPLFHDPPDEPPAPEKIEAIRGCVDAMARGSRVFFNTPFELEQLEKRGIAFDGHVVDALPPSIDFEELDAIPETRVEGIPEDKLLVSFVGRLDPQKGVDTLLEAFAAALRKLTNDGDPIEPRVHLAVAGFRDTPHDYPARIRSLGLEGRVTLLEDRPRADIVNLLRASRVFAFPSRCETFGIAVTEAWATRNDVLVSNHTALPYVVEHGVDGTVVADDEWVDRLVVAIRESDNPAARARIERGYEKVRREHDRKLRIAEYAQLVERSITSARHSRT